MKPCAKCGMIHTGKCDPVSLTTDSKTNKPPPDDEPTTDVSLTRASLDKAVSEVSLTADVMQRLETLEILVEQILHNMEQTFDRKAYQRDYMRKRRAAE